MIAEDSSRRFPVFLGIISLASAILYVAFGSRQFIEYDGYWHLFVAQLDDSRLFFRDLYALAHPPLYIFLLKAALVFGRAPLVYRGVTILSGAGSVFLIGWITRKITGSEVRAYQAAVAYGLSIPVVIIACEVRAYMVSVFFVLLSFSALLDIGQAKNAGVRVRFAVWTILACLAEYVAFFYAGAALLCLAAVAYDGKYGDKSPHSGLRTAPRWRAEVITALPILAAIAALYEYAAGHFTQVQGYLTDFYFDSRKESLPAFLLRNSTYLIDNFLPFTKWNSTRTLLLCGLAILVAIVAAIFVRHGNRQIARSARITFFVTAASLAAIVAASVVGKYPYGGFMRQQFQLYPFFVLCLAVIVEFAAAKLRPVLPAAAKWAANAGILALAIGAATLEYRAYPQTGVNVLAPEVAAFEEAAPSASAVYVDQWNLITFFIYHHNWRWTSEPSGFRNFDRYRVEKDGRKIIVFRDLTRWDTDPDENAVYPQFAAILRTGGVDSLSTFTIRQSQAKGSFPNLHGVEAAILTRAPAAGICVDNVSVNSDWWYVTLKKSGCRKLELPGQPHLQGDDPAIGAFADDASPAISYVGNWGHAPFPRARNQTVSFSNDAGAIARAVFEGRRITWMYTAAFNRGIGEVRIDGVSQGKIDLFSPATVWQSKRTFTALTDGRHMFELMVTGEKNSKATDRFVDIDALYVP